MNLPEGFLDELKGRIGLPEVIGKTVKLARRGRQFLGLCPFHGEKTPSFHVYDDHYHCFGCGAHGSVIDFVMQAEKLSFPQAVERLAAQAGMTLPSANREEMERERRRGSLYDVLEAAAAYYQKLLRMPEGKPALDYLRLRGVSEAAIDRFRLGYAPEGRFAIKAALAREGFPESAMIEAGLLVQPEDESRGAYDRFRGRLMFPIADRRGRVVGFGGRILGAGEPKYLNSPETPLFHKGRLLYNLADGSKAARDKGIVIVVEGYMDAIGLTEAGWDNVVAPLGTALTEEQLHTLWRLAPEPVLLFDPDAAGERAALRAAEMALPLLKPGFGLRSAFLDTETRDDPDGVVRRYPKQFLEQTLARSLALSEFIFRTETRGRRLETAEDRAALAQRLRQRASAIADADLRRQFLSGWRQRLWEAGSRRGRDSSESGGKSLKVSPLPSVAVCLAAAPPTQRASAESSLLSLLLHDPQLFVEVEDEIGSISFAESELERLRQALIALLSANSGDCDADALDTALRAQGLGATLDRVMRDSSTFRSTQESVPKQRDSDMEILSRASLSELQNMSFSDPLAEQCRKEVIAKSEPPAERDRNAQVPVSHSSGRDGTADRVGGEPLNDRMKDDARSQWIAAMSVLRRLALREELSALRAEGLSPEAWVRRRALIEEACRQSDD